MNICCIQKPNLKSLVILFYAHEKSLSFDFAFESKMYQELASAVDFK